MLTDDDVVRDRRLLCAANLTYDIMHAHERSDCRTDRDNFDLQMSGLHTYQGFISGFEFADAGLIGVTDFEILLAFRGTQPLNLSTKHDLVESISDWIHDFDADLVRDRKIDLADWTTIPGRIHRGFLLSMKGHAKKPGLWTQMKPALRALIERHPGKPVCITGHSKGGALAHLAAMQCAALFKSDEIYVCTFAAPRVGDKAFAEAYAQRITHSYRYEYHFDVVPLLPPSHSFYEAIASHAAAKLFTMPVRGYSVVGKKKVVAEIEGAAHSHPPLINCLTKMLKGEGRQILEYHSSRIGHHYANAVGLLNAPANENEL